MDISFRTPACQANNWRHFRSIHIQFCDIYNIYIYRYIYTYILWNHGWKLSISLYPNDVCHESKSKLQISLARVDALSSIFHYISWDTMHDMTTIVPLQWRHNERDSVSNHRHHDRLFNGLFKLRSKKPSELRITGLCERNSPVTGKCFYLMT